MKVWVCRNKKTGEVVDILPVDQHRELFPDTKKTFDCSIEDWTQEQIDEVLHPAAFSELEAVDDDVLVQEVKRRKIDVLSLVDDSEIVAEARKRNLNLGSRSL